MTSDVIEQWRRVEIEAHEYANTGDLIHAGDILAVELKSARERIANLEATLQPFVEGRLVQQGPRWCCRYCAARAALEGSEEK